ncbi:MAG: hypothetical protein U9R01_05210 [candidate division WOR-3 bacterium]|nr:hypothetical protein [candidate division WOR-3 bacterium]
MKTVGKIETNAMGEGMDIKKNGEIPNPSSFGKLREAVKDTVRHSYMWAAELTDGSYLTEYNRDGTDNRFNTVLDAEKKGKLKALWLVPLKDGLPSHVVIFDDDKRVICKKRHAINMNMAAPLTLFMLGWQTTMKINGIKKNVKSIFYVDGNGNTVLSNDDDMTVAAFYNRIKGGMK